MSADSLAPGARLSRGFDWSFDIDLVTHPFPDVDSSLCFLLLKEGGYIPEDARLHFTDHEGVGRLLYQSRLRFVCDVGQAYLPGEWPDSAIIDHHGVGEDQIGCETCAAALLQELTGDYRFRDQVEYGRQVDNAGLPEETEFERVIRDREEAWCRPWEYFLLAAPRIAEELAPDHEPALRVTADALKASAITRGAQIPQISAARCDRGLLSEMPMACQPLRERGELALAARLEGVLTSILSQPDCTLEMEAAYQQALAGDPKTLVRETRWGGTCLALKGPWPARSVKTWAKRRRSTDGQPRIDYLFYRYHESGTITGYTIRDDLATFINASVRHLRRRYGRTIPIVRAQDRGYVYTIRHRPATREDPSGDQLVRELVEQMAA